MRAQGSRPGSPLAGQAVASPCSQFPSRRIQRHCLCYFYYFVSFPPLLEAELGRFFCWFFSPHPKETPRFFPSCPPVTENSRTFLSGGFNPAGDGASGPRCSGSPPCTSARLLRASSLFLCTSFKLKEQVSPFFFSVVWSKTSLSGSSQCHFAGRVGLNQNVDLCPDLLCDLG